VWSTAWNWTAACPVAGLSLTARMLRIKIRAWMGDIQGLLEEVMVDTEKKSELPVAEVQRL